MEQVKFVTEAGTPIYWKVSYDLGGYNQFTSEFEPRGYSLSMQRCKSEVQAFADLGNSSGSERLFLLEVSRQSKARLKEAGDMVSEEYLQEIANIYGI